MKKFWILSVVLGSIWLTGCENAKEDNHAPPKISVDKQKIDKEKMTTTEHDNAPIPLVLTQEQKEQYYKEYTSIVNQINGKYQTDFEINPIHTFSGDDWLELKDFEDMLKGRIDSSFVMVDNKEVHPPGAAPKLVELHMGKNKTIIRINGSFDTQLSANTPEGRQLFSALHALTSEIEQGDGKWTQTGYDPLMIDEGRVYYITVGGYYSFNGVSSPHNFEIEYYCNENGGIT